MDIQLKKEKSKLNLEMMKEKNYDKNCIDTGDINNEN